MLRHLLFAAALVTMLWFTPHSAWASDPVVNGQFDEGLAAWDWSPGREGVDVELDEDHARAGQQSLRLTARTHGSREQHGTGNLRQTLEGLEPGTLYRLSLHARGRNLGRAWVGEGGGDSARQYFPGGDNDWQRIEVLLQTRDDQTAYTVEIALNPSTSDRGGDPQTLWIDDVRLTHVPDADLREAEPLTVYLSWQRDPTSTMTVHWHSHLLDAPIDQVQWKAIGDEQWRTQNGAHHPFPFTERRIHVAELTGLEPDTAYRIRFDDNGERFLFRTMPRELNEPVRFVTGGDMYHPPRSRMAAVNAAAAAESPMFAAIGGDWAYANGNPQRVERWFHLLDDWQEHMVTPDGRLVPFVPAIGNHEVRGGYRPGQHERAPFYYALFALPEQRSYFALDFGEYLSMIALDTDHTEAIEGEQTDWLASTLAERAGRIRHLMPFYHVPAYPSVRSYDGSRSAKIREHWVPLFEQHGVRVAFENHDHAYKRTHPLRGGEIDEDDGLVYIGDGCWGVSVRDPRSPDDEWYLAESAGVNHFILVEIEGDAARFEMIDRDGQVFDEYGYELGQ